MSLALRPQMQALPAYTPPQEGRAGLRLDFNENTVGCSPAALAALRATSAEDLARYPAYAEAEAEIAAAFGHTPATALLTNGVDDAILLAAMALLEPGDEAIIPVPSFALYRFYCQQCGVRPVEVAYRSLAVGPGVSEFRLDPAELLAAAGGRTRAIFLASPNNPTGHAWPPAQVLELARALPQCLIFADEAYADFVAPGYRGLLPEVERQPNLLVARTFSKAYGLAGARLGCLFAHPALLPGLRKVHSPYNVNTLAVRCARAAVADAAWVEDYRRQVVTSRGLLTAALAGLGIPYWRSAANFVLFDAGAAAAAVVEGMRWRGILIRDRRADWPGALRLTCGAVEHTQRACAALGEVWSEAGGAQ
ncbi:MAG TPA: histidinol-phosphate transaminase [Terriglobales bacterium]|nr:histidinol-phosphate transaminase [Terriglobales bacterium]